MGSIEVKWITSSSQTQIQVAVSGTDWSANFCVHICMSRISCLRLYPIRKQLCLRVCQALRFRINQQIKLPVVHTPGALQLA